MHLEPDDTTLITAEKVDIKGKRFKEFRLRIWRDRVAIRSTKLKRVCTKDELLQTAQLLLDMYNATESATHGKSNLIITNGE